MKTFISTIAIVLACFGSASNVSAQAKVHPAFNALAEKKVRGEWASYEEKGRKCAKDQAAGNKCAPVSFSTEQSLKIPLQTTGGDEPLTFQTSIFAPLSEVRSLAYRFGRVNPHGTPEDRKDLLDHLVARMKTAPTSVVVVMRLEARHDWSTPLPSLNFSLVNESQGKVSTSSKPSFDCPVHDLLCQAAMLEDGQSVTFPLITPPDNKPFLTDTMKRVTMIVTVGGQEVPVVFDLNSLP